jgi:hypothetical protein
VHSSPAEIETDPWKIGRVWIKGFVATDASDGGGSNQGVGEWRQEEDEGAELHIG